MRSFSSAIDSFLDIGKGAEVEHYTFGRVSTSRFQKHLRGDLNGCFSFFFQYFLEMSVFFNRKIPRNTEISGKYRKKLKQSLPLLLFRIDNFLSLKVVPY